MTPEETVRELRAVQKKYENVVVYTFDTNIHDMAMDAANTIEELLRKLDEQTVNVSEDSDDIV